MRWLAFVIIAFLISAQPAAALDVGTFLNELWSDVGVLETESVSTENSVQVESRTEATASGGNSSSVYVEQTINGEEGTMEVERTVTTVVNGVSTSSTVVDDVPKGEAYVSSISVGDTKNAHVEVNTFVNTPILAEETLSAQPLWWWETLQQWLQNFRFW